ncbi:MAG: GNAT family N-acetyltransferase [Acidobacteriota bacterium]
MGPGYAAFTVSSLYTFRAAEDDEMPVVRRLFQEYAESIGIDLGFQGFEQELANLPGEYAVSRGGIFLAVAAEAVGCVAVRPLEADVCEMKRLYVRPSARGADVGRHLALTAVACGRARGYRVTRLDTLATMTAARALYGGLGFREVPPYCYNPFPDAVFMERELRT